jgi:hypothetical protein
MELGSEDVRGMAFTTLDIFDGGNRLRNGREGYHGRNSKRTARLRAVGVIED